MPCKKTSTMNIRQVILTTLFLFGSFFMQGQEVTENTFGKGIFNIIAKDSTYSMKFAARFQSLYTGQWDFPGNEVLGNGESNFLIRRSRLKFEGFAFSPKLEYKVEVGLSNRDISGASIYTHNAPRMLLDAVLKWNFHGNFQLWAGQTKLPGNRERVISSASLETVDRSLLNSRFNIDRDMGVQLHHFFELGNGFLIKEALAFSQGEGRNVTLGNLGGYQYTARAEFLPFGDFDDYKGADLNREEAPKLSVGVSFDHNSNAVKTRSNSGSYMAIDSGTGYFETDINTFFLDAMFKYQGISFMGEYARRSADRAIAVNSDGTPTGDEVNVGEGLNLQAGYTFRNHFQVLGRYTGITPDEALTGAGAERQYTFGLSKYISGHNLKVQTDVSLNDFANNQDNSLLYRLQFDIHF